MVSEINITLFTCPRHPGNLRLTPNACAASYQRGKTAKEFETARLCRGCPIGASHSGEEVQQELPETTCRLCPRKKIAGRKIVYGNLCISCYNRLLEAFKGRNAKHCTPQKLCGRSVHDAVVVARQNVTFVGRNGRLAWIARSVGRMPTGQISIFEA
jgi:hypothetical protein